MMINSRDFFTSTAPEQIKLLRRAKISIKGYFYASKEQEEHALAFVNIKPPELQLPASLALTCRCSWRENVRWSRKISCDQWPAPAAPAERNSASEEAFLFCRIWHFPLSIICVGVTASMFICAWQSFTSSAATTFVFYNICQLYNNTDLSALTVGINSRLWRKWWKQLRKMLASIKVQRKTAKNQKYLPTPRPELKI